MINSMDKLQLHFLITVIITIIALNIAHILHNYKEVVATMIGSVPK